jgi:hypothetical protein
MGVPSMFDTVSSCPGRHLPSNLDTRGMRAPAADTWLWEMAIETVMTIDEYWCLDHDGLEDSLMLVAAQYLRGVRFATGMLMGVADGEAEKYLTPSVAVTAGLMFGHDVLEPWDMPAIDREMADLSSAWLSSHEFNAARDVLMGVYSGWLVDGRTDGRFEKSLASTIDRMSRDVVVVDKATWQMPEDGPDLLQVPRSVMIQMALGLTTTSAVMIARKIRVPGVDPAGVKSMAAGLRSYFEE